MTFGCHEAGLGYGRSEQMLQLRIGEEGAEAQEEFGGRGSTGQMM